MAKASNDTPVRYDPLAQIGSPGTLLALLERQRASLAASLPKHVTPERIIKTMLVAVNRNPELLACTQASILETISRAAELGLDLSGTVGEAYPVPFTNRVRTTDGRDVWVRQCQLVIGYRGLAKLARQSGEISVIDAEVVRAKDDFRLTKGTGGQCTFAPRLRGDRGDVIGAFAFVRFRDGGEQYEFMSYEEIEAIRKRSKSGSDEQGRPRGVWATDWAEMARKTVFRRLAKWLPLSADKFQRAVEVDNEDYDLRDLTSVDTLGAIAALPKADAVAARMGARRNRALTHSDDAVQDQSTPEAANTSADLGDTALAPSASEPTPSPAPAVPEQAPYPTDTLRREILAAVANANACTMEEAEAKVASMCSKLFARPWAKADEATLQHLRRMAANGEITLGR